MTWRLLRQNRLALFIFCAVFCFLLSITTLLTTSNLFSQTIRSDGKGYYLYLPAVFIYHDLTMQWTKPPQQADPPGPTGEWYGLTPYAENNYLNKYPIGQAILWMPFFLAAHVLTLLSGQPVTGFTVWYQASIGCAAAVYTALGCAILYKLLRRSFSVRVSYFTMLTLLLGTNMLNYATYDGAFTHVYSLLLIASVLYVTPLWYKRMTYRTSLLLAVLLALTILVRQTNSLIVLAVLLWDITSRAQVRERIALLWQQRLKLVAMAGIAVLLFFPQLFYWKYITGRWLIFSYRGEGFNFLHPQLINILFSTDRGALFWAPVLCLALIGLVLMRRYVKEWSTALYVFLPVWLWIMASWHSWQFGASYGHRIFIDIFPLLGLAIAAVYSRARSAAVQKVLIVFVGLCIFANLFLTYQYWIRGLPISETTLPIYFRVWWQGLSALLHNGLAFGLLGLFGLMGLTLMPLTHYALSHKEHRATLGL